MTPAESLTILRIGLAVLVGAAFVVLVWATWRGP